MLAHGEISYFKATARRTDGREGMGLDTRRSGHPRFRPIDLSKLGEEASVCQTPRAVGVRDSVKEPAMQDAILAALSAWSVSCLGNKTSMVLLHK